MSTSRQRSPRICTNDTVRSTVRTLRREEKAPNGQPSFLSRQARNLVRRHAIDSRGDLPEWARLDLFSALDTAEALESRLAQARYKLAHCREALRLALQSIADADAAMDPADGPAGAHRVDREPQAAGRS